VALTTLATLLLELSLTRIFSVVFYYHFVFLAISIALFGLGAGGVFSYVVAGWKGNLFQKLGRLSAVNSLLVILAVVVVLAQGQHPTHGYLTLTYFAAALPFFVAGTIVSLVVSETIERVNRVYFFDLAGAAGGCLLLVFLLEAFGGPDTTIVAAVLFAAAAAVWHSMSGASKERAASVALALALFALLLFNGQFRLIDVTYAKGQKLEHESFVKWNSFSRIALAPNKDDPGSQLIFIDADASTGIANFDFAHLSEHNVRDLLYQGPGLPYAIRPGAKTLIIGPGGGWDVARALASGSHDITGVEINPIIATTIMREKFPQLSRNLYLRPDVHIHVEDGRAFVRRSTEKYQVLQATLVDTWASTAAGAFAFSENNLYTTEAFGDYLTHLTDDGILAFTRWGFDPPRESLRLISLAMVALRNLGEADPAQHILVGREGSHAELAAFGAKDTVLISRRPFQAEDLNRARHALAEGHMTAVYMPDERLPNQFTELLHSPDPAEYQRRYPFDISAVTDNRPFFFYTVQPSDLWNFITRASTNNEDYKINSAVPLLFELLAISVLATVIVLALPPLVLRTRLPRQKPVLGFLLYFLAIGAGYILVEVALIQKFVLFLGHPTYALTVVIFSLLVSSGLGSYASRRVIQSSARRWRIALVGVALLIAFLAADVSIILPRAITLPLLWKIVMSVALILPAGFLMGMPFPVGLARLEQWESSSVRWAWSLNAAASVLGSVASLVLAIYLGLVQTLLIGGVLYLAALVTIARDPARTAKVL
jgi:predicted membrane-bound spermidine synthase